ncbi:MAG TPA: LysR family transcriptional regulator [Anaerolineales bacterium]|nr:LysR family transcriptional regulator [Anaerolineales bacterium]
MINVDRLNVFLHVADSLSFSIAAQQLHLSQPTVSKHINELEKEINANLFERSPGGVQLTEAGQTLVPLARKMVRDNLDLQNMMGAIDHEVSGHLNIACSTTAGKYILPQLAARFRQRNPGVRISISHCSQENISSKLLGHEADLGVISVEITHAPLECQYFFTDFINLILPASHPWANRTSIEPDELLEVPILMREPTSGTRHVLQAELAKHEIRVENLNILLEVGSAEAIVACVSAGLGAAFVSQLASASARAIGCVVEVPVNGLDLKRKICIGRKSMGPPNRAMDAFWGFIHSPENDDLYKLIEM